jgi:hypothetical protein
MEKTIDEVRLDDRKPYTKPEIVHELDLETRAGTTVPPENINP